MKTGILILKVSILIGTTFLSVSSAYAVENVDNARQVQTDQTIITTSTTTITVIKPKKRVSNTITLKKTNAQKEIGRRLDGLARISYKINNIKSLSGSQKQTLLQEVQDEVKKLTDLRDNIESETDANSLASEKKSISERYHIYALYIPKIEIMAHADRIIELADAMTVNTTDQTLLEKIASSKINAQSAINLVMPLLPEQYPNFRNTLNASRDLLQTARLTLSSVYATIKAATVP